MKILPAVITADQIAFTAVEGDVTYTVVYAVDGLIDSLDQETIDVLQFDFEAVATKAFLPKDERVVYFDVTLDAPVDDVTAKKEYEDSGAKIPIGKDKPIEVAPEVIEEISVEEGIKP